MNLARKRSRGRIINAVWLTEREEQYLEYMRTDLSQTQIAGWMHCSSEALKVMAKRLRDKLGFKQARSLSVWWDRQRRVEYSEDGSEVTLP